MSLHYVTESALGNLVCFFILVSLRPIPLEAVVDSDCLAHSILLLQSD